MKTHWEVCTGGGTSAAVLWGMGKVTLCREWTDKCKTDPPVKCSYGRLCHYSPLMLKKPVFGLL